MYKITIHSSSTDLVLTPLDTFDYSMILNLEDGVVFLWKVVSPHLSTDPDDYYFLSSTCGENLHIRRDVSIVPRLGLE